MKEFYGESGGRTAFNEDFESLRDLALSFHHIFDDCDKNFILSGCNISFKFGSTPMSSKTIVGSGYVWLDGKIREVKKTSIRTNSVYGYIVPDDASGTQINYATKGVSGEMYYEYGTKIVLDKPSDSKYIEINLANGIIDTNTPIQLELFGGYVLVKKGMLQQKINSDTSFKKDVNTSSVILQKGNKTANLTSYGNTLYITIKNGDVPAYYYQISNGVKCHDSSNKLIFDLSNAPAEQGDGDIVLPNVTNKEIEYDIVNTTSSDNLYLSETSFRNVFYPKTPSNDWTCFFWDDGTEIGQLMIKRIAFEYYISGMLPINSSSFKAQQIGYDSSTQYMSYKTNIVLPFSIATPTGESDTWEENVWAVRGENITYQNTCTIWYIKDKHLCYKAYIEDSTDTENIGIGTPCPSTIFWNFITN